MSESESNKEMGKVEDPVGGGERVDAELASTANDKTKLPSATKVSATDEATSVSGQEEPGCSGDAGKTEEFKRINSSKRNYRNSKVVDSSEDSNEKTTDNDSSGTKDLSETKDLTGDGASANVPTLDGEDTNDSGKLTDGTPVREGSGAEVERARGDESVDPAGQDNDDGDHEEDIYVISDTESSDSSLPLMDDDDDMEQDSSSDSSDCILEDLEDPIAVRGKTDRERNQDSNESTAAAEAKTKKDSKKPNQDLPDVLRKPKPKHSWDGPRELLNREVGYRGKMQPQTAEVFRSRFYGSLFSAERLELMKKLDGHNGCVNCLNFNYAGTKLASGSDDLTIKIWNYGLGKLLSSFQSGHRANVFQAKFLPVLGVDNMIVSCARDNQVRLNELDETGEVGTSRKLAQHKGPAHKLSVHPENPHVILSCGEDSVVYSIDIREDKPQKLVNVREKNRKVALYSVHSNPLASYEFCVAGRDEYVRVYDARKLSTSTVSASQSDSAASTPEESSSPSLKRFCPQHLVDSRAKAHVTAAVYNYNGKEILGSYNDENIYLFNATHSDMADCIKVYEGHRNSATVKGVNFFGDRSQFVISGSDCGHIFIWDKETESIVNFFRGDENGVVNCLEPHPAAPILATSGLDDDVKIWIPSNEKPPKMGDLTATVRRNLKKRKEELDDQALDGHMMLALLTHMRRTERRRRREAGELSGSSSDDDDDDEEASSDGATAFHYRNNDCCIS